MMAVAVLPQEAVAQRVAKVDKEAKVHVEPSWAEGRNNDLRVSIGFPGAISWLTSHGLDLRLLFDTRSEDFYYSRDIYIPPISLEYNYTLKPWCSFGAKAVFSAYYCYKLDSTTHKILCTDGNWQVGIVANVRFEYMRRELVRLYSGIGLGATLQLYNNSGHCIPMIDMTYIGVNVGKQLYGFAEFGGGLSGLVRTGMGWRF